MWDQLVSSSVVLLLTLSIERTACSLLLAVLAISSSLLPAVNRSDMALDAPCAGSALLLFAVRSQRGQSLAFSARRLLVSALLKRIDVERPRFLSCFLIMNIYRSGLAALSAFNKIQSGLEPGRSPKLHTLIVSVDARRTLCGIAH